MFNAGFYRNRRVLVTGHTGFKGSWLCEALINLGADVTGYSLEPPTTPNLFSLLKLEDRMNSIIGDIRDKEKIQDVFNKFEPEVVFHLAAQPIVRDSYKNPVYTYEVNVMGTVNVLECIRKSKSVKSFLNVTTDKVYRNMEWEWGYRENEVLDGFDPYSNSKSCSELVTASYKRCYMNDKSISVSTARAGNVIGGGDFSVDRIIPDCIRAVMNNTNICVRNPNSIRPYQHVLEPIFAYLMIAQKQYEDIKYSGEYNVGPDEGDCVSTGCLVNMFCKKYADGIEWVDKSEKNAPHEANFLKLDCSKMKGTFGWKPLWNYEKAVEETTDWLRVYLTDGDIRNSVDSQINEYLSELNKKEV